MKRNTKEKVKGFNRSIEEHRVRLSAARPLKEAAAVSCKDVLIPLRRDVRIPIRIYRPKNITPPYPTLFYVPGTAFVAKELAFTEVVCTHIAEKSSCQVIVINHRLAPENQFPKGLDDAYNLLRFIVKAPVSLFNIEKNKIAIVGYSSGGTFAASMAICGKDEGLPIARQILISPMVDLSRSLKDFKNDFENKDTAISDAFVEWFLGLYLPEGVDLKNPWLSPFWHKPKRFQGLPPTDIFFAEYDRFRSDAQAYYDKLTRAGVDINGFMVKGEDHSFLWYKLEIVEAIGLRIKTAFGLQPIPEYIPSSNEHQLYFIKPRIKPTDCILDDEETDKSISSKSKL